MVEPRIVGEIAGGKKLYWCFIHGRQLPEDLCKGKYFKNTGRAARHCRVCLGVAYGKPFPEPWASIGEKKNGEGTEAGETTKPDLVCTPGSDSSFRHPDEGNGRVETEEVNIDDGRPPTLPGM